MFRGKDVGVQVFLWQHSVQCSPCDQITQASSSGRVHLYNPNYPFFEGFEEWQKDANQKIHNLNVRFPQFYHYLQFNVNDS